MGKESEFSPAGDTGRTPQLGGGRVLMLDFGGDGPKSLLRSPAPTQHRVPHGENVLDMPPAADPGRAMASCPRHVSVSIEPVQAEDR